jgi:hypothetical protein
MVRYPITVARSDYRGRNPAKLRKAAEYNQDAAMLEDHINEQIKNGKTGVFHYATIASEVGLSVERVSKILFSVDCGHNGFTVVGESDKSMD